MGFTDRTSLLENPQQLRETAEQEGYLFFRGLLPKDRVLGLRRQILEVLQSNGLLDPESELMDGIANPGEMDNMEAISKVNMSVTDEVYLQIQKLEEFHTIAHDPALLRVYSLLFGEEPFPHPRNICRIILPHSGLTPTPPHQDFLHIQGTPSTWTCWFPLGDCPQELGGLAMLEGSHRYGMIEVRGHAGAGGLETILCDYELEWSVDGYSAGDVIVFHSYMVHKGMPRQIPGHIRLSCDFRYQPASEKIDRSSLLPHGPYQWNEIYEGWTDKALQYYWKSKEFELSDWDESIRWQKDKIC